MLQLIERGTRSPRRDAYASEKNINGLLVKLFGQQI